MSELRHRVMKSSCKAVCYSVYAFVAEFSTFCRCTVQETLLLFQQNVSRC